jgi:hypothetical protein
MNSPTIGILYGWSEKQFAYNPKESVGALLKQAVADFGINSDAHPMSLFNTHDDELAENLTVREAGVEPGVMLLLRERGATGPPVEVQWSR